MEDHCKETCGLCDGGDGGGGGGGSTCQNNSEDCEDLKDYCRSKDEGWKNWMEGQCKKTCGLCDGGDGGDGGGGDGGGSTCQNNSEDCEDLKDYCRSKDEGWKDWMEGQCKKTCGLCDGG